MGVRRLARTRIEGAEPHSHLWGTAETEGARALVHWRLEPHADRTRVEVRLDVELRTWKDRTLLRLGGRAWLGARLRAALDRLAQIAVHPRPSTQASLA
jgi:hypothetical protein